MIHTKGKWTVTDKADTFSSTERDIIISDRLNGNGNRKVVARIHGLEDGVNNAELRKEAIANANLIASAPELLKEYKDLVGRVSAMKKAMNRAGLNQWTNDWLGDGILNGEAIAKAEGK